MNGETPYISPPPDTEGPYKYCLVHGFRPVRVICDEQGIPRGFETPDWMEGGRLKLYRLIARFIELGSGIENITKDKFAKLCREAAEETPCILPPPEADGPYKYYLLGNTRPVRVTCDESGRRHGAEAPEIFNGGRLAYNHALLGRLFSSSEVEDLTKEEFVELCRRDAIECAPGVQLPKTKTLQDLIPANLYDGTTSGAPESHAQARIDRQKGLLREVGDKKRAAEAKGETEEAAQLEYDLRRLRHLFKSDSPEPEANSATSITLYRVENPFWLTDATVRDGGDLVITSGDAGNDWSTIVPADGKPALVNALLKYVTIDEAPGDDADDRLLRALSAMFAGDKNPYEDIKSFLERHTIPAKDSNWLW